MGVAVCCVDLQGLLMNDKETTKTYILSFQVLKLSTLFFEIINADIFFIDFERPKYVNNDSNIQTSNRSHPGTPSISSSFKPSLSGPSPANECVSAWRHYFIANEWQKLVVKRKISLHLHIFLVVGTMLVSEKLEVEQLSINQD